MQHSRDKDSEQNDNDGPVPLVRAVENASQTRIQTVNGVNLQPKEKVILIIAPDDFHDDATKCDLGHDSTVPDSVKKSEIVSELMHSFSAVSVVVFLL